MLYNFYCEICKVELLDNELIIEKKKRYEVEPFILGIANMLWIERKKKWDDKT